MLKNLQNNDGNPTKDLQDSDGNLTLEAKAQAEELVLKIAAICKDYPPALVLFVLEAALTEQISILAPPLSELFTDTMKAFKDKAVLLLSIMKLLKGLKGGTDDVGLDSPQEPEPQGSASN